MIPSLRKFLLLAGLCAVSFTARAQINVSITIAPPELPVYEQPPCPVEGYLWTPGYWEYAEDDGGGYYWVPGAWVEPPRPRVLWTPGYWGFADGVYAFHDGYWGDRVGFYGGVNYGYGYGGVGYGGGGWEGDHFRYNTAITRVNTTVIHNTYVDKTVINDHGTNERVSFNGGPKGIKAEPTEEQRQIGQAEHVQPTAAQQQRREEASHNKAQFVNANHGKPESLTANPSGEPKGAAPEGQRPGTHIGTPEQRPDTHVGTPAERPDTQIGTPKQEPTPQRVEEGRKQMEERAKPEAAPREEKPRPEAAPREERPKPEAAPREEKSKPETAPREEKPKPEAAPREKQPRPEAAPREEKPKPEAAHGEEHKEEKPKEGKEKP